MRIIQVSSYYPPHLGGQENAAHDLSTQLAAAGHEVHVLASSRGDMPGKAIEQGVQVQRMSNIEFGHAPIMPQFAPALWQLANDSVVHVHIGQAYTPEIVWLMAKLRGFPYIAHLHIDFEPSGPAGFLLPLYKQIILKRVLRSAFAVAVLNNKTLQLVRQKYGVKNQVCILNNGIEEAYFLLKRKTQQNTPPKKLRLLFVGRLSKQKNLLTLMRALALTKRDVHVDIIGEGDQRNAIEQCIRDLRIACKVTLHGRLDRSAILPFYSGHDALIMPSLYEAQPMVLLEAMAARIPIIGTNVIGVGEHIQKIGIIVEPTAEDIASGFEKFDNYYNKLPAMVQKGYQKVSAQRWSNLLQQYEDLYEEALKT